MKSGTIVNMVAGAVLGAAAMSMMNRQTQRKIKKFAEDSSQKLMNKTNEIFGK